LDKYEEEGTVICSYPGVVAIVRPMDLEVMSRWNDAFPKATGRSLAATTLVFDQLLGIEGLSMKDEATKTLVPFDATNAVHKRSIPMDMRSGIFLALKKRGTVSDAQESKSGSPSDSGGTSGSESSPAVGAASASATS
jgi:hypothetical protein